MDGTSQNSKVSKRICCSSEVDGKKHEWPEFPTNSILKKVCASVLRVDHILADPMYQYKYIYIPIYIYLYISCCCLLSDAGAAMYSYVVQRKDYMIYIYSLWSSGGAWSCVLIVGTSPTKDCLVTPGLTYIYMEKSKSLDFCFVWNSCCLVCFCFLPFQETS